MESTERDTIKDVADRISRMLEPPALMSDGSGFYLMGPVTYGKMLQQLQRLRAMIRE